MVQHIGSMGEEVLFNFIHSLTKGQKSNYSKFSRDKRDSLEYELYIRILRNSEWSKKARQEIRQTKFADASIYYKYRLQLATNVINSIIHYKKQKAEKYKALEFRFIYCCIQFKLFELAEGRIGDMVNSCLKMEDFHALRFIQDEVYKLNRKHSAPLQLPEKTPSKLEIQRHVLEEEELDELIQSLKGFSIADSEGVYAFTASIRERLERIAGDTLSKRYKREKLIYACCYFERRLNESVMVLEKIVAQYRPSYAVSFVQHLKDISNLIKMAAEIGDQNLAVEYSLYLCTLTPRTTLETSEHLKRQISNTIVAARTFANVDFALRGKELVEKAQLEDVTFFDQYLLAISFFINEKWDLARVELEKAIQFHAYKNHFLKWELQLLLAVTHFELENLDLADDLLRSSNRTAQKHNNSYGKLVISTIKQVLHRPEWNSKVQLSRCFDILTQAENEMDSFSYEMVFSIWVKLKMCGVSQSETVRERELLKFTSLFKRLVE